IVTGADQGVNDFGPVALAEAGESMLCHPGVADAILREQRAIDEGVLRVHVKNPRAELLNVRDGIDELTHEVAGVPLDTDVFTARSIEEPLPHGRLAEHVIIHDRQVIGTLRAMLEAYPQAAVRGGFGQRFPERNELRDEIL